MPQYSNIETPAINMVTIKIIMDNFNLVEDFNIKNGDSNRTITKLSDWMTSLKTD